MRSPATEVPHKLLRTVGDTDSGRTSLECSENLFIIDTTASCLLPGIPITMSLLSSATVRRRAYRHLSKRTFSSSNRPLADHVRLVEVGPRDGLQNEKQSIPAETKTELVRRLARTGLETIEAGSFVAPKWVPQVCIGKLRRIACQPCDVGGQECTEYPW